MKILTAQQMRELDRLTVERCCIPFATLMESAGSRVVEAITNKYGAVAGKNLAIFCGKGNNGGDGAVAARLFLMSGVRALDIFLFGKLEDIKGDARLNFEIIKRMADASAANDYRLSFREIVRCEEAEKLNFFPDLMIDALLGTGVTREVDGVYLEAISCINTIRAVHNSPVISVDIPSGLSSDSGNPIGPHVRADLTVSFTAPKIGNVLSPAADANGSLAIVSIGTPDWLIKESGSQLELVEEQQITNWLSDSRRKSDAHKTAVGDVLLIAGSYGKTGAAALASQAVLRAGAGLVTVATAKSAQNLLVTQTLAEVMTEALAETFDGAISLQAVEQVMRLAERKTVIAIGPGLYSGDESTRSFVRKLVECRTAPMVIDADGLNALSPWPNELKGSDELPIILTPHPGEMARLIGKTNSEVQSDRIGLARVFAVAHQVITVLKGSRSLIAAPDGIVYVIPTGNAGMASAGSGDVLTGLIAGLLAQKPDSALSSTIAGVYLHALAGDIAAGKLGMRSMIASDIIANLSEAIMQVGGEAEKGRLSEITRL